MKEDLYTGAFVGFWLGLFVALILAIAFLPTYDEGYCKAKGGTVITNNVCNVHGKVVNIP